MEKLSGMERLENKVILVTGGSGLLGKAFVNQVDTDGGIAINCDINVESDLDNHTWYTDITSESSIREMLESVVSKFGRIDGLVNNAYPRTKDWGTKFEDIPLDSWRKNVDMQMNSYFYLTQQLVKDFQNNGVKSVVNITSIYGVVGNDLSLYEETSIVPPAAYSAIKGGIINFTRFLTAWYGKQGIRFNCVSPGGIFDHQPEPFVEAYNKKVPMGRMGNPEDIAPAVSFLLSEEAQYITGQNLVVDGGWTAI